MSHLFVEKATEEKVDAVTSHNDGGDVEDYDYDHEKDDLDSDADVLGYEKFVFYGLLWSQCDNCK